MDKALVTIIGVLGVNVAAWVVWQGRTLRTPPPRIDVDTGPRHRFGEAIRQVSGLIAAGLVGGLLSLGLGSRLMMRLLAATSPDAAGRRTDADEIVGEVTLGGTIFLVGFLAFFGVFAALSFGVVRRLLPDRSLLAGLVAAAMGGAVMILPSDFLDPGNRDFRILEPTWFAVPLCVGVIALTGLTIAVLADRALASWPSPARSRKGIASLAPLIAIAAPPVAIAGAVLIAARTIRLPAHRWRLRASAIVRQLVMASSIAGTAFIGLMAGRILF